MIFVGPFQLGMFQDPTTVARMGSALGFFLSQAQPVHRVLGNTDSSS